MQPSTIVTRTQKTLSEDEIQRMQLSTMVSKIQKMMSMTSESEIQIMQPRIMGNETQMIMSVTVVKDLDFLKNLLNNPDKIQRRIMVNETNMIMSKTNQSENHKVKPLKIISKTQKITSVTIVKKFLQNLHKMQPVMMVNKSKININSPPLASTSSTKTKSRKLINKTKMIMVATVVIA